MICRGLRSRLRHSESILSDGRDRLENTSARGRGDEQPGKLWTLLDCHGVPRPAARFDLRLAPAALRRCLNMVRGSWWDVRLGIVLSLSSCRLRMLCARTTTSKVPPSRWRSTRRGPLRSIRGLGHSCSLLLFPRGGGSRAAPTLRRHICACVYACGIVY